jgi:hypothetical protein
VINIPTIQIDTPVDYSSNDPLPSELMESIKNRLPSLDQVYYFHLLIDKNFLVTPRSEVIFVLFFEK